MDRLTAACALVFHVLQSMLCLSVSYIRLKSEFVIKVSVSQDALLSFMHRHSGKFKQTGTMFAGVDLHSAELS